MSLQSLPRVFSKADISLFDEVRWEGRTAEITDDKNEVIFR